MADILSAMPSNALTDPASGQVTPSWRAFFERLLTRTGGNPGVSTPDVQAALSAETSARSSADATLHSNITAETTRAEAAEALLLPLAGGAMTTPGTVTTPGAFGFWAHAAPASKPVVTGSRGGNAALASLLTALASYGIVTDSSTP